MTASFCDASGIEETSPVFRGRQDQRVGRETVATSCTLAKGCRHMTIDGGEGEPANRYSHLVAAGPGMIGPPLRGLRAGGGRGPRVARR